MQLLFPEERPARYLTDMQNRNLIKLKTELASLTVFRSLLSDPVLASLEKYISTLEEQNESISVSSYSDFVSKLYECAEGDLTRHIENICYNCENVYVRLIGQGKTPPEHIKASLEHDIEILQMVASLTSDELTNGFDRFLPGFRTKHTELLRSYCHRINNIGKYGYGKYALHHMFCLSDDANIIPVLNPDPIRLGELIDYERQRGLIIDNTKALLDGKPAANILLTGDAGTGKSSTVKAVVNEFYPEGLRLIELRKEQLRIIPKILDELAANPLKFILFIDDLAFLKDDDDFNALKAVLEGSVSARSKNTVIYVTGNRRHLVKEKFSDREGDEVHRNDSVQEMISLSERFGLHITFEKPSKQIYLNIVKMIASQKSVSIDKAELEAQAERFALERGGRSARLARQFVDSLLSK